ncbi:MAG: radical SAM protein [Clostridia bacterium]|nr:radical SAM protein [Clostridia bacterium]
MNSPLIIPFFIPHAGCPFTCVFCNQWEISGEKDEVKAEDIDKSVEEYLKRARIWPGRQIEIAYFGGTFTAIPVDKQIALLEAAAEQKKKGRIKGIRLSTRPDCINEEILERLLAYGVTTVELGAQSLVDEVLEKTHRGHSVEDIVKATRLLRKYPFQVGYQLMLGLPGDTNASARLTGERAVELAPDIIRIYPTLVLKGTTLARWYAQGKYAPWTLERAVEMAAYWLGLFSLHHIPVIRMGLNPTENISPERDLLAGPYHSAFGELVENSLMLKQIVSAFEKEDFKKDSKITILCNSRSCSKVIGQKRCNFEYIKEKYGFSKISIEFTNKLGKDDLVVCNTFESITVKREDFLEKYRI